MYVGLHPLRHQRRYKWQGGEGEDGEPVGDATFYGEEEWGSVAYGIPQYVSQDDDACEYPHVCISGEE